MNEFLAVLSNLPISLRDVLTLIPIFIIVGILFYLSNREIKKSLEQSRATQEILAKDHEYLVKRLDMSDKELRETRQTRLNELAKAAEFGRLAQGLFHDLMTPLTSVILHTEKLKESSAAHQHVEKAVDA